MYEKHFGLRENPFPAGHQLRFLYPSREHQEARAHLRYGIENREPFVLITGEVGTGKTTALYDALAEWGAQVNVALITNSALTRQELLEEICLRFGVATAQGMSKPQMLSALERHLLNVRSRGEHGVLLLDEAQNLAVELLEEIRLLSNTETQGEKLLQIFLVGQPELEAKLARPELRQLRQRITVHYRLNPLSPEETTGYIHHRISVAGGNAYSTFPPAACREVYRVTHGIPREINTVAAQALLSAYAEGAVSVRPDHVHTVANETEFKSVLGDMAAPVPTPAEEIAPVAAAAVPAPAPVPVAAAPIAPPEPPPATPRVIEAPAAVPTWTPPELAHAPELPELEPIAAPEPEPVFEPMHEEVDHVRKDELDAWTRAAQELLDARRRTGEPDAPRAADHVEIVSAQNDPPRFPTAGELAAMGETARPDAADLSALPARLREKIENDIAAEERRHNMLPWILTAVTVAALAIGAVLLQRFQVIDVPLLRPLAGTPSADSTLAAPAPTTSAPVAAAPADSSAGAAAADTTATQAAAPDTTKPVAAKPVASASVTPQVAKPVATPVATAATTKPAATTPATAAAVSTQAFGIGVGSFLDRDRAETERARLAAATQLEGSIYPYKDAGTTMYRVVLGRFKTNGLAESAANGLMTRNQVREARVLVIGGAPGR